MRFGPPRRYPGAYVKRQRVIATAVVVKVGRLRLLLGCEPSRQVGNACLRIEGQQSQQMMQEVHDAMCRLSQLGTQVVPHFREGGDHKCVLLARSAYLSGVAKETDVPQFQLAFELRVAPRARRQHAGARVEPFLPVRAALPLSLIHI